MTPPNFEIVANLPFWLIIRDVGPWTRHMTVTNDAESVVQRLTADGNLQPGQRLAYFDSEGQLDELLVRGGHMVGFRVLDPEERAALALVAERAVMVQERANQATSVGSRPTKVISHSP